MQSFHRCELKCVVMEGNLAQYRLETDFKSVSEAAYQVRTSQLSLPQKVLSTAECNNRLLCSADLVY